MGAIEGEIPRSWDRVAPEQLRLYAQELARLYHREQELRQEVEVRNRELEQRVRELLALNKMFQQHLDLRMRTEDAFQQFVDALRRMVQEAEGLLQQVREGSPPNPGNSITPP